jgi:hypothetical protein
MAREAASGPAVGQVDVSEQEEVPMTAAQMAEEEARRQVSEVVDVMMTLQLTSSTSAAGRRRLLSMRCDLSARLPR